MDHFPAVRPNAESQFRRLAHWLVGLAAAALVLISVGDYFYHRDRLAAIAAEHLRLIVAGPSSLFSGVAAEYIVSTTTIGGEPLPAEIEATLLGPDGARLKAYKETADQYGRLQLVLPGDLKLPPQTRLKVVVRQGKSREEAETSLVVRPPGYSTQLVLDRPLYRPGETVYYRAIVFSRFSLAAAAGLPIYLEIHDPHGGVAPKSRQNRLTDRGVASGEWKIPDEAADGRYTLVARGVQQSAARGKKILRRASRSTAVEERVAGRGREGRAEAARAFGST